VQKIILNENVITPKQADSGSAMLGDLDILNDKAAVRKILGYLPQEFGV
jgi:ABC-type multidrug transport system ATPase subunit